MLEIETFLHSDKLFDGHYRLLRALSTDGGTADVWLAIDTNTIDVSYDDCECSDERAEEKTGMLVAIKIYRPKNALDIDGEQRFRDEFKIVYECRHENLVQPTNFSICEGTPYLVLPYCRYGSAEQLIGKKLTKDEIWKFVLDVSSGLSRLHTNEPPIIHQDIKPANILIDNSRNYAITDFGISSKRGGAHGYYYDDGNSGTMAYMAPERFLDDVEPMFQSDIWAFGATLYEILAGKVPFGESGGKFQAENNQHIQFPSHVPADIQRLISDCLSLEPGKRPSAEMIKEAAKARCYPASVKRKLLLKLGAACVAIALVAVVSFALFPRPEGKGGVPVEKLYEVAMADISSDDTSAVRKGIALMDSLSNLRYIPAIYQMAYTYGWYIESESLKRKRALGIEVFQNEREGLYLPKMDMYSNEALALLSRILEINDSAYAGINAQAAYRLACYYVNPNQIIKPNMSKGKMYLEQSRKWALLSEDTALLGKIDRSLQTFK